MYRYVQAKCSVFGLFFSIACVKFCITRENRHHLLKFAEHSKLPLTEPANFQFSPALTWMGIKCNREALQDSPNFKGPKFKVKGVILQGLWGFYYHFTDVSFTMLAFWKIPQCRRVSFIAVTFVLNLSEWQCLIISACIMPFNIKAQLYSAHNRVFRIFPRPWHSHFWLICIHSEQLLIFHHLTNYMFSLIKWAINARYELYHVS